MSSMKDKILKADRELVEFPVPAWGVVVYLRKFSLGDRLSMSEAFDKSQPVERIALLVARSVHDVDGVRLFTDADAETIKDMDGEAITELANAVRKLNKLETTAAEQAEEKKD